ncbi:SHC-transforming protein 1 [Empidonax traillii]|uniref:SHC-transforming protein 1 n=1 Tax=Empidonax traillii TaxID=164674 RepID=UPI000FFCEDEA|nr:SHC-transforming protein 1 [Empidonax traillii]
MEYVDMNKLSCGKKTRVEGGQLGGDEWTRHGSFVNKPTRGWLHPDDKVMGPGVSYHVRYMGCVEVLQSMRALDFNTRTQVTREAIGLVCEAVPGAKGAVRRRKPCGRSLNSILGKSNLKFAGMPITLTISTSSLNLMASDCKQVRAGSGGGQAGFGLAGILMSSTSGLAGDVPSLPKECLGGLCDLLSAHLPAVPRAEEVGGISRMLCGVSPGDWEGR